MGTDIDKDAIGKYFCDKFYIIREETVRIPEKYKQIFKKEKNNLIIPTSDEEISLSRNKDYD